MKMRGPFFIGPQGNRREVTEAEFDAYLARQVKEREALKSGVEFRCAKDRLWGKRPCVAVGTTPDKIGAYVADDAKHGVPTEYVNCDPVFRSKKHRERWLAIPREDAPHGWHDNDGYGSRG